MEKKYKRTGTWFILPKSGVYGCIKEEKANEIEYIRVRPSDEYHPILYIYVAYAHPRTLKAWGARTLTKAEWQELQRMMFDHAEWLKTISGTQGMHYIDLHPELRK